jgi:hypothetical protein
MKRISLIFTCLLCSLFSFAQLNLSTFQSGVTPSTSDWTCISTSGASFVQSTFYGHTNWVSINNPQANTTFVFERKFWACKSGNYLVNISKALGDNHLKVFLNGSLIIDKDAQSANDFNYTASYKKEHKLKCGMQTLRVEVKNYNGPAGFMLDCLVSALNGGSLSNGNCECCCEIVDARANVTINCSPGNISISASGMSSVSGLGQGWVLKKVSCPLSSNCTWLPGPITAQGVGSNFNYNNLQTGGCYILTHYVNNCSKKWNPKDCRVGKTICFTVSCPQLSTGRIGKQTLPLDDVQFNELTPEMEKEIQQLKNN